MMMGKFHIFIIETQTIGANSTHGIRIDCPEYFHHEGESDVLNSKQKTALQKFMESKVSLTKYKDKFSNNWELICFMWDINNSDIQIDDSTQQPNYVDLPN